MLEEINNLLDRELFTANEQTFTLGQVLLVPILVIGGLYALSWVSGFLKKRLLARNVRPDVAHLAMRLFFFITLIILVITTLDFFNIPITAFAFVSGAVAIGVGFGAQNIINNFISGWILMWERPIRIGDFLEIENTSRGFVESINTRSTRIRRVDGVHMLIPNSKLLENTVINWTLVDRNVRTSVKVGVAYGSPTRKVSELITQVMTNNKDALTVPEPLVIFDDFGDSALIFEVYFWVSAGAERDLRIIRSNIRHAIDEIFKQNNITIAFPQRDIHLDGRLTLERQKA
ncbi:mechanosensitive ion channel [Alteromonas sp. ASW11-36]|uniref:Mechanosensitive ion channel n=1 Tax=Alteromonas arenosi TaxID=3055817 RepID=A0ABT7SXL6_9ALTE|nr:mechanosensitive ion channel domain-containing protein [Alteromonas sp. ASW11-36]MDM7860910.1 mechanosensitive ion channel [Alteromonas sp. ASW11-36]